MIVPPGEAGVAFSEAVDGDILEAAARTRFSDAIGVGHVWARVRQVHGAHVLRASAPGSIGEADALWTSVRGLPVGVFTADCFGVVVIADGAVGVAHAGWRGVVSGVVPGLVRTMGEAGHSPRMAYMGPGIGPCCFEVGPEVAARFPEQLATTTWGTTSVDLAGRITAQLGDGIEVVAAGGCTRHDSAYFSHRRDGTSRRMVALGWVG